MPKKLLYLSRADVEAVALPPLEMLEVLERAFRAKGAGEVEMPPKPGVHPRTQRDAFIHAMPCYVASADQVGMKWVSGFPENTGRFGLPYISGLIIMNDASTGLPVAVLDCTWITAQRTAIASLLSARHLARPAPATMGILACGVQGDSHLGAFLAGYPSIREIRFYDIRRDVADALAEKAQRLRPGVSAPVVASPEEAVTGMEIVVTSGPILKHPKPVIRAEWLAPGVFVSAVDFDSYLLPEAQAVFERIYTDDAAQLGYYRREGYFQRTPEVAGDLGDLAAGRVKGRTSPSERLCAMNLGVALEDVAVASQIIVRARERGLGVDLPL